MRRAAIPAALLASWLAFEPSALACGTCSLDKGGQELMLIAMLTLPLVVAAIGYGAIRKLLARLDSP
jgi:hypothetical protein